MTCTINNFSQLLSTLDNEWPPLWQQEIAGPIAGTVGLSFGSCWGICGSLGLTSATGLGLLRPDITMASVTWPTCTNVDSAAIAVPLAPINVTCQTQVRASGAGILWPTGPGAENVTATAVISGLILITVPLNGPSFANYRDLTVDLFLYGQWVGTPWPDSTSFVYNAVPFQNLINTFIDALNTEYRPHLTRALTRVLKSAGQPLNCTIPVLVNQTCSIGTTMPSGPCDPCDKCCRCLIQQRCDGDCSDCSCVTCNVWFNSLSTNPLYVLFIILIVVFIGAWMSMR